MTALPILQDIVFGMQDSYSVLDLSRTETGLEQGHTCMEVGLKLLSVSTKFVPNCVACCLPGFLRTFRCLARTPKCTKYNNETLKHPPSSNFILHSEKCSCI